jgi:hypothetical protein
LPAPKERENVSAVRIVNKYFMIDVSAWYFKSSPQRRKEHKEKTKEKAEGLSS